MGHGRPAIRSGGLFPVFHPVTGETSPGPDQLLSTVRVAACQRLFRRIRHRTGQVGGNTRRLRVIQMQRRHEAFRMVAGGVLQVGGQNGGGHLGPDAVQGMTFRRVACGAPQGGVEAAAPGGVHGRSVRDPVRRATDRPRSEIGRYVPGFRLVQQGRHGGFGPDRCRIKQPTADPRRVQASGGVQAGSAAASQRFGPACVAVDASQVLHQVPAPFDLALVPTGRAFRRVEQDAGRDRLQGKVLRFPEQPELGRPRQTAKPESNAMPARGQGNGFGSDLLAADLQPAAALESIAARLQNRKDARPFGLKTGFQRRMQGLPFLQVEMGSRRHQAEPDAVRLRSGPTTRAGVSPSRDPVRSRRRVGPGSRTAGARNGDGKQDNATVDPKDS